MADYCILMPSFDTLWKNYPDTAPCDKGQFENQCAIRMGVCLAKSGVTVPKTGNAPVLCWLHDKEEQHILRAQEFATALKNNFREPEVIKGAETAEYQETLNQQNGIIFLSNYWGENNQGDHIDLWDGTGVNRSRGFGRRTWSRLFYDSWTDADEIWFWSLT